MSIYNVLSNSFYSWGIASAITAVKRGSTACLPQIGTDVSQTAYDCFRQICGEANMTSPFATVSILSSVSLNCLWQAWNNIRNGGALMLAGYYLAAGLAFANVAYSQITIYDQACLDFNDVGACKDQLVQSVALTLLASALLTAGLKRIISKPLESVAMLSGAGLIAYATAMRGHALA